MQVDLVRLHGFVSEPGHDDGAVDAAVTGGLHLKVLRATGHLASSLDRRFRTRREQ